MTTPPATMTAIAIADKGGPEVLQPVTLPVPSAGPGQLLVKVAAAGVNRPDVMQRQGLYPAPKGHSEIPGLEIAGTVAAVGEGTARFKVGDRVLGLVNGGGYAEYCLADESVLPAGACQSRDGCRRPPSRRASSPSGTTCSSAAGSKRANGS